MKNAALRFFFSSKNINWITKVFNLTIFNNVIYFLILARKYFQLL